MEQGGNEIYLYGNPRTQNKLSNLGPFAKIIGAFFNPMRNAKQSLGDFHGIPICT